MLIFKGCVEGDHWSIVQPIEFTSLIVSWVNSKGQYAFLKWNVFIFRHRECINQYRKAVDEKRKKNNSILKECFFVLKGFDQFQELKTTAKKSSHVPLIGFLCFLDLDELLFKESWLKNSGFINILLWEVFVNITV